LKNADAVVSELKAGTREDLDAEALRKIRCPVSLIVGDTSAPFLQAASERLRHMLPAARVIRAAGGNHIMNLERPDDFVARVREALA
jgi:pimeloyl-ACP methyl ester carboxylesterase